MDELAAVQQVIQALYEATAVVTDPEVNAVMTQALNALSQVQKKLMAAGAGQGGGARQALVGQLGGGAQAGY